MRRFLLLSFIIFVLAALAVPALAGKPTCEDDPTRPWCDDPPTTTTTTTLPDQVEACSDIMAPTDEGMSTTITGKGNASFECLWTPERGESVDPPSVATVTISDLDGGVKGPPYVFVRDDSPGDICLLEQEWAGQTGPTYVGTFDLVYGSVESLPDGYEAWANSSYWDFVYEDSPAAPVVGAHWCAPQDPVLDSLRYDTNGTPLHLQIGFNARGGGSLTVTLSTGQG